MYRRKPLNWQPARDGNDGNLNKDGLKKGKKK
jgi:hypothetical protein